MAATNRPAHGRGTSTDDPEAASADGPPSLLARLAPESTPGTLRALAFWAAVVLPFLHVPLLASGLDTPGEWYAFLALLGLNVGALYLGHGHDVG